MRGLKSIHVDIRGPRGASNKNFNQQNTPHISSSLASYGGVSIVRISRNVDRGITALSCTCHVTLYNCHNLPHNLPPNATKENKGKHNEFRKQRRHFVLNLLSHWKHMRIFKQNIAYGRLAVHLRINERNHWSESVASDTVCYVHLANGSLWIIEQSQPLLGFQGEVSLDPNCHLWF